MRSDARTYQTAKIVKYVVLATGVIVLLPLDIVAAVGMSFTATSNFKISYALFLLFACLLDIPAVAVSFVRPRLGSIVILSSAGLSLAVVAAFFLYHGELPTSKVGCQVLVFWGLKIVIGAGLLWAHIHTIEQKGSPAT